MRRQGGESLPDGGMGADFFLGFAQGGLCRRYVVRFFFAAGKRNLPRVPAQVGGTPSQDNLPLPLMEHHRQQYGCFRIAVGGKDLISQFFFFTRIKRGAAQESGKLGLVHHGYKTVENGLNIILQQVYCRMNQQTALHVIK